MSVRTMTDEARETWWVLEKDILIGMLYRARYGEDPDMLYIELAANANTEIVEGDE